MCSMSFTFEVRLRSKPVTTRFSISSGERPPIDPKNAHDGNIDIRKNIDRHGDDSGPAQDGDQNRHDDEGVGAGKREPDDPHIGT